MNENASNGSFLDELPDGLQQAVSAAIQQPLDQAAEDRALQRALQIGADKAEPRAANGTIQHGRDATLRGRRLAMFRRLSWSVAAAAAVIGVLTLFNLPWDGASRAFAQVQQAMAELASVSFRVRSMTDGPSSRVLLVGQTMGRVDFDGGFLVFDSSRGESIRCQTKGKTATVFHGVAAEPGADFFQLVRRIKAGEVDATEPKEIDGRNCPGFRFSDGKQTFDLWVHPETMLPVYAESQPEDAAPGQAELRIDQFTFNIPVSPSDFKMTVPDGYAVIEQTLPADSAPERAPLTLVAGEGLGGVRFGMSRDAVVAQIGEPDATQVASRGNGTLLRYDSQGFWLELDSSGQMAGITCHVHAESAARVARTFSGTTNRGIAMKATSEQIVRAYGRPDGDQRSARSNHRVLSYFRLGLNFVLQEDHLVEISAHRVATPAAPESPESK